MQAACRRRPEVGHVCKLHNQPALLIRGRQRAMHSGAARQILTEGTSLAGMATHASPLYGNNHIPEKRQMLPSPHPQELTEGTSLAGIATKASTTPVTSTGLPSVRLRRSQVTVRRSWYSVPSTTWEGEGVETGIQI